MDLVIGSEGLPARASGAALFRRQIGTVFRVEIGRILLTRRSIPLYVLALVPVAFLAIVGILRSASGATSADQLVETKQIYAIVYSGFVLGAVVFFGSAFVFTRLFRSEMLNRSLHYYLMTPMRREVLAFGKYLAGFAATLLVFGAVTVTTYVLLYLPWGMDVFLDDLTAGNAAGQIAAYLRVTLLGCLGYGAVFLLFGVWFKNPIFAIAALMGWEVMHFILPPALKAFSIIHYLKGLLPLPVMEGPLAVVVAAPTTWVSIFALTGLASAAFAAAAFSLRRIELRYTEE